MKKIISILLASALAITPAFARAGKSYSRSSSSSSSHSYSAPSRSYSSASYARPALTQVYRPAPVAAKPMSKPTPSASTSATHTPVAPRPMPTAKTTHTPAATHTPTASGTSTHTTVNKTTVVHQNRGGYNGNGYNGGGYGGGGMGIGGTILGVAGGIVAGNLLYDALTSDHRNAGYVPAGGYAHNEAGVPNAGQPVAPAMAGATEGSYVTDGKGGVIPAAEYQAQQGSAAGTAATPSAESTTGMSESVPVSTQSPVASTTSEPQHEGFSWDTWYMWIVYVFIALGVAMWLSSLYDKWKVKRQRTLEKAKMLEEENNLEIFKNIFMQVQRSYASNSRIDLIDLVDADMYKHITMQKDHTEEQGLINVVEDVKVISLTNESSWVNSGVKFQRVKIRFSMIDYTIDDSNFVHHGSQTEPETAVEYWTFKSNSKGDWVLDSIAEYNGYVHQ